MSQERQTDSPERTGGAEVYGLVEGVQESYVGTRTAAEWVPFFLPLSWPSTLADVICWQAGLQSAKI